MNDESNTLLINQFYQIFINQIQPRAEALRQAQLTLLKHQKYPTPHILGGRRMPARLCIC
ncbi:hypothetical protein [Microcoleus sp. FACHB-1515]|uniref:hypothetical protein n=1 Tax=Microcoleus sp. FACHB-1515 TaxID=2692821 RepID=UPI0037CBE30D